MGVSSHLKDNLIIFVLEGENTVEQAKKAFAQIFSDESIDFPLPVLIDARHSCRNREMTEVAGFAEALLRFREKLGCKCALVINEERQDPLGLERRLAAFSLRENIQFGLFFEIDSARTWLKQI